jgi:dienelactone hydrolase
VFPYRRAIGKVCLSPFVLVLLGMLSAQPASADIDPGLRCQLGSYVLSDGRSLVVTGVDGIAHDLAYALSSGEYGRMTFVSGATYALGTIPAYGSASFSDCAEGNVTFNETGKPAVTGHRAVLTITDTFFDSGGTRLHGKLVMPANGNARAIVVWIQGSDDDPATDDEYWQYELPPLGIGVFVFDKRGSGGSKGELSADFYVRANDTAAAVREARRLAPQVKQFGDFGGSQGGWIAPLAATDTALDFVIVGYGLAEGVTAQDRDEVEEQVRAAGYGDDTIEKVRALTTATARIVKSHWKNGWQEFAALRRKYQSEPWIKAIQQENGYTGIMLRTPIAQIKVMGPKLDKHVSFNYDPRPVIATIMPRQLWVLGGSDRTTPNARTLAILADIQKHKSSLDIAIYRDADHGIVETFQLQGATRHRHPASLSALIAQWISMDTLPSPDSNLEIRRPARRD